MIKRMLGRDRGATLVEAALVAPVFALLVFGTFEFGYLLRSHLTVSSATTEAARAASVAANGGPADYLVLQSLAHGLEPIGLEGLERVVVYHAAGPGDPVPPACLSGSVNNATVQCNSYTVADVALPYTDAAGAPTGNWGCEPSSRDLAWCPLDRETGVGGAGPDYVGIHVEVVHHTLTGFFQASLNLSDTTVVRLEPNGDQE